MKLIFCPDCWDVVKLAKQPRQCGCGAASGYYHDDGLHATIGGSAIPLGIANDSFADAIQARPKDGLGSRFEAFVIPQDCPTVEDIGR